MNGDLLTTLRTRSDGLLPQQRIEDISRNAVTRRRDFRAYDVPVNEAAGGADLHWVRKPRFGGFPAEKAAQKTERLRLDKLAANFLPRKHPALQEQHARSSASGCYSGGRSRRPTTDYRNVIAHRALRLLDPARS